jgi:hypothetical protein
MENPRIVVVVCIFDRWENLRRWTHAWNMCEQLGAKLVFIHNHYPSADKDFWKWYCKKRGVDYIIRPNIGYETGIIYDVINGNLLKDEWDVFFFATDDTLPIKKGFLREYVSEVMKPDVGVACMQVSGAVTPHVRTTGWCIRKDVANNITFPRNPADKSDCYNFEHLGGGDTLMAQVLRMDKRVVQMSNIGESSIWDNHHAETNRWDEWHKEFPGYN